MIKNNRIESLTYFICAISLVLLPLLAPYKFFGPFSASHILLIIAYLFSILYTKRIYFIKSLFFLFFIHSILSMGAYFIRIEEISTDQIPISLIYILINIILIMQVIKSTPKTYFIKSALIIGILSSIFLCYQYVLVFFNINPPDGKLPFLIFKETSGWANIDVNNIYMRRVHSFFPEPSYFAIFILPLLAYTLSKNKVFISMFFLVSLFLSTSSLGIIVGLLLLILKFLKIENLKKKKKFLLVLSLIFIFFILFNNLDIFNYNTEKIQNLGVNSDIRLIGYLDYFFILPDIFQIIGVGSNQFVYYFEEYNLKNYSNAFVISLLNFGFLGFFALVIFIITRYMRYKQSRSFIIIFFIICCVDAFLYNMYFFYILSYIYIFSAIHKENITKKNTN